MYIDVQARVGQETGFIALSLIVTDRTEIHRRRELYIANQRYSDEYCFLVHPIYWWLRGNGKFYVEHSAWSETPSKIWNSYSYFLDFGPLPNHHPCQTQEELDKKFSETTQYNNLKKMLSKKNEQLKEMRTRLRKHEPTDSWSSSSRFIIPADNVARVECEILFSRLFCLSDINKIVFGQWRALVYFYSVFPNIKRQSRSLFWPQFEL